MQNIISINLHASIITRFHCSKALVEEEESINDDDDGNMRKLIMFHLSYSHSPINICYNTFPVITTTTTSITITGTTL